MSVNRARKETEVEALKKIFNEEDLIVVTHYSGLTVSEVTKLRRQLREQGASFKVTKNTLARRALEGTKFAHLADMFTGPTGVAFSKDPIAAAKVTYEFAMSNDNLIILGGAMGKEALDKGAVIQLAKLPSLDALRGKIVGLLKAPASKVAGVIQAPAGQLARVIGAYAAKDG